MPTTVANNQSPDCQSILYPQTSPLASHRPTRPTAVVPPLPKDPIISSPMSSITTASSMTPSSSNYQQVSPQKPPNYQKQVSLFERARCNYVRDRIVIVLAKRTAFQLNDLHV
jgi:hypothetical protein